MEALAPAAALEDAAGELVDDLHLAVLDDVVDVALEQLLGAQRGLELVDEVLVDVLVEVVDAERLLDPVDALFGGHDGALRLVDLVVAVALRGLHDRARTGSRAPAASSARPEMISGVRASSMRIESTSSTMANAWPRCTCSSRDTRHVVAEVVEAELVVRAVGDVGARTPTAWLAVVDLGDDDADLEPEEPVDLAHPLGVALGEVVVHRDEVHALPASALR